MVGSYALRSPDPRQRPLADDSFQHGNEPLSSIKGRLPRLAKQLLASHKNPSLSMYVYFRISVFHISLKLNSLRFAWRQTCAV
jgi:hypothetical protein